MQPQRLTFSSLTMYRRWCKKYKVANSFVLFLPGYPAALSRLCPVTAVRIK